jgi:hypothetical protein
MQTICTPAYRISTINNDNATANGTSRRGLRVSPAATSAASNPTKAKNAEQHCVAEVCGRRQRGGCGGPRSHCENSDDTEHQQERDFQRRQTVADDRRLANAHEIDEPDRNHDDRNDLDARSGSLQRGRHAGQVNDEQIADRRERQHARHPIQPADDEARRRTERRAREQVRTAGVREAAADFGEANRNDRDQDGA